ncbi:hypothetical protein Save01_09092 [Streptomyces avermitilis]
MPVPPVMRAVPCGSIPRGTVSTALPTSFAWLRSRIASRARRRSYVVTGGGTSTPARYSSSTATSISWIRSGPASIRSYAW